MLIVIKESLILDPWVLATNDSQLKKQSKGERELEHRGRSHATVTYSPSFSSFFCLSLAVV